MWVSQDFRLLNFSQKAGKLCLKSFCYVYLGIAP